jgi:hypothetical protein
MHLKGSAVHGARSVFEHEQMVHWMSLGGGGGTVPALPRSGNPEQTPAVHVSPVVLGFLSSHGVSSGRGT